MASFGVALQEDFNAICAKYSQPEEGNVDEIYLSELYGQGDTTSDDSDVSVMSEGEDEGENSVESDGFESDTSGPSFVHVGDESDRGFLGTGSKIKGNNSALLNSDPHESEPSSVSKKLMLERLTGENVILWEKETSEAYGNPDRTDYNSDEASEQLKPEAAKSKKRICDATFIIEGSSSGVDAQKSLLDAANKPVSIVQPIMATNAEQMTSKDTTSEAHDSKVDCGANFAQAVLCSRNKIALALARILQEREPDRTEFPFEMESGKHDLDSCFSPSNISKKTRSNISHQNLLHREYTTSCLTAKYKSQRDNNKVEISPSKYNSIVRDFLRGREAHHDGRRRSIKIKSACSEPKTKRITDDEMVDLLQEPKRSAERRSVSLCQFDVKTDAEDLKNNAHASSASKAVAAKTDHHSSPMVQKLFSSGCPSGNLSGSPFGNPIRTSLQILKMGEASSTNIEEIEAQPVHVNSKFGKDLLSGERRSIALCANVSHAKFMSSSPGIRSDLLNRKLVVPVEKKEKPQSISLTGNDSTSETSLSLSFVSSLDGQETRASLYCKKDNNLQNSLNINHDKPLFNVPLKSAVLQNDLNVYRNSPLISPSKIVLSGKDENILRNNAFSPPAVPRINHNANDDEASSTSSTRGVSRKDRDHALRTCSTSANLRQHRDVNGDHAIKGGDIFTGLVERGTVGFYESACVRLNANCPSNWNPDERVYHNRAKTAKSRGGGRDTSAGDQRPRTDGLLVGERCNVDQCGNIAPFTTPVRKRTARESIAIDIPDVLPNKQAKTGSPTSSDQIGPECVQTACHTQSSTRFEWTSSPARGVTNYMRGLEDFTKKTTSLSPIKQTFRTQKIHSTPCQGRGRCGKTFCFQCG